jgi:DUF1680 family protein
VKQLAVILIVALLSATTLALPRDYAWNNRGQGEMAVWIKEKP